MIWKIFEWIAYGIAGCTVILGICFVIVMILIRQDYEDPFDVFPDESEASPYEPEPDREAS